MKEFKKGQWVKCSDGDCCSINKGHKYKIHGKHIKTKKKTYYKILDVKEERKIKSKSALSQHIFWVACTDCLIAINLKSK